jgi:hypothetical protein
LIGQAATRDRGWRAGARSVLIIVLTVFLLPGCGISKAGREKRRLAAQKKATPPPKAPQLVGTIVLVSLEGNFVLIDNESRPSPAMGTALRTGKEEIASAEIVELKVTEIRKRPFVIADIVRGHPQKGDLVFE